MPKKSGKREKTTSFVCELPLKASQEQEGVLLTRLEAGRQLYNACLGEAMRRLNLIKQSRDYQKARSLKREDPERKVLFKRARESWKFSDYDIQSFATEIRRSWIGDHIDAHTAQKLATRAYLAVEKVLFKKAKRVRFKGKNQMDSLEGKSNAAGIRWRNDAVEWNKLRLTAIVNRYDSVVIYGLSSRVKYVRLVRRKRNGRNLFYAQLVCEGRAFQKPKNKVDFGNVGIDIGPSTIAIVGDSSARLEQFASQLQFQDKQIRKLQRQMERSRRANNPENYNPNGTIKQGKKKWNNSHTYLKVRDSKANLERRLAGHRKSLHGQMVNSVLAEGNVFKLEKLSYKAFQKLFGKSVGKRAPGMFVAHLKRKAENAGATVVEFPTYSTKLSQTCQCGRVEKKKLSERVHRCECGVHAQRDLYSAFLAKYIDPDTYVLQVNLLLSSWESAELRLRAVAALFARRFPPGECRSERTATINQPATGGLLPSSFGCCPETEQVAAEVEDQISKSQDDVARSVGGQNPLSAEPPQQCESLEKEIPPRQWSDGLEPPTFRSGESQERTFSSGSDRAGSQSPVDGKAATTSKII